MNRAVLAGDELTLELIPPMPWDRRGDATRACLLAWCTVNGLPTAHMLGNRTITVYPARREIDYWEIGDVRGTGRLMEVSGDGPRRLRAELVAEPVGILIGEDVCGHMQRRSKSTLRCNVEVDATGRHPGTHVDGLHDNAEWPNENPGVLDYRRGRPDVTGRTPHEQHVLVLTALDERASMPHPGSTAARDLKGLDGRRRILDRHQPMTTSPLCDRRCATWPCPDYTAAAAGLVTGLETPCPS